MTARDPDPALDATAPGTDETAPAAPPGRAGGTDATLAGGDRRRAAAPRTLGRYQLGARLGAGGMGQVFRAHDPQLNRDVAIKLLHPGGDTGSQARELEQRLLREAQAMARLSHPNLVVVHDVGSDGGEVFLAMELIAGETLRAWLARPRPWREALAALLAAGRGLAAAHSAGVIHRDFKPDNVLVATDGAIKVVDFGLARGVGERPHPSDQHARADVLETSMTVTGAVMGTPAYMAPEQQTGEPTDARADQFSFAVAVYEALWGARPFPAGALATYRTGAEGPPPPPPPPARPDGAPPAALWPVVARALARDPEDRFPSMTALLDALDAAATPAPARPPRRRWWPLALEIGIIAGGGALGLWLVQLRRGGDDAPAPSAAASDAGHGHTDGPTDSRARPEIRAVIHQHMSDVHACYREAVRADATLPAGTIAITFEIGVDGRVRGLRLDDGAHPSPTLAACVAGASMRWSFPPLDAPVTVTHPFTFATTTAADVTQLDDTTFRVSPTQRDAWLADPSPLATARLTPSVRAGVPYGVKLYAVNPASAMAALGFLDGDTVLRVDDVPVVDTRPETLAALRTHLRDATALTVTVTRRGEPLTPRYVIE